MDEQGQIMLLNYPIVLIHTQWPNGAARGLDNLARQGPPTSSMYIKTAHKISKINDVFKGEKQIPAQENPYNR